MERPIVFEYVSSSEFIRDMIAYRKKTDRSFSVHKATRSLRRVSPTLVSLLAQGKRKLTLDRVDEISRLLDLNTSERLYLRSWISEADDKGLPSPSAKTGARKETTTSILNDWINLFVKDFFQFPAVQRDPSLVEKQMLSVATPKRVKKAIQFLLREGHLRRTMDGRIEIETQLTVTDPGVPSQKIRQFHKGALQLAKAGLELFPPSERLANTLIMAVTPQSLQELRELFQEFAVKMQQYAAHSHEGAPDRLYQVHLNLSPVGGKLE